MKRPGEISCLWMVAGGALGISIVVSFISFEWRADVTPSVQEDQHKQAITGLADHYLEEMGRVYAAWDKTLEASTAAVQSYQYRLAQETDLRQKLQFDLERERAMRIELEQTLEELARSPASDSNTAP